MHLINMRYLLQECSGLCLEKIISAIRPRLFVVLRISFNF